MSDPAATSATDTASPGEHDDVACFIGTRPHNHTSGDSTLAFDEKTVAHES